MPGQLSDDLQVFIHPFEGQRILQVINSQPQVFKLLDLLRIVNFGRQHQVGI